MKRKMIILFLFVCLFITGKTHALVDEKEIKNILIEEDLYDSNTQDIIIVETEYSISEEMQSKGYDNLEEQLKIHEMSYIVELNGKEIEENSIYYSYNTETKTLTAKKNFPSTKKDIIAIFIVDKNSTYNIYTYDRSWYYDDITLYDSKNKQYNGYARAKPIGDLKYNGTTNGITHLSYSFEWNMYNFVDLEFITINKENKIYEFLDIIKEDSYLTLNVELRDKDGNITQLPKTYFNNYGSNDNFIKMIEEGIMYVEINGENKYYGEMDFYLPLEYDYKITIIDNNKNIGLPAYYYNADKMDNEGFVITNKEKYYDSDLSNFFYTQHTFAPIEEEIKIFSRSLNKNELYDKTETFNIKYTQYNYYDIDSEYGREKDTILPLYRRPLYVYDIETNEFIREIKTDENGDFSIKIGEYAVIETWSLPEDFKEYTNPWFTIFDVYESCKDLPSTSEYIITRMSQDFDKYFIEGSINGKEMVLGKNYKVENNGELLFVYDLKKSIIDEIPNPETKDVYILFFIIISILFGIIMVQVNHKLNWLK